VPFNPDQGLLDVLPLQYNSSLVSSNIFVRFFNAPTLGAATYYGNSSIWQLPAGTGPLLDQALLDFAPSSDYAHVANQPISFTVIPEPSNLLLFAMMIFGIRLWQKRVKIDSPKAKPVDTHMRNWAGLAVALGWLMVASHAEAQLTPQDIQIATPILDHAGSTLPGSLTNFGCTNAPGGLVQILQVGSNSVAHLPNLDGTASGGDTVLFTTFIGDYNGLNPCATGHQLDTSFTPHPANGTKIYARVFDAATIGAAGYWGQSATFSVNGTTVFDLNTSGLKATTMPKGIDLTIAVTPKGLTYYEELIANTNPLDPNDRLATGGLTGASNQVSLTGHVGRVYTLQRTTDLAVTNGWADIASTTTGPLNADTDLILTDPAPPATLKAFYRVKVSMP
jgi:hypothetical protein